MVEVANQELNRADFDRVLAVLQHEQEAMKLTRWQRISYWFYTLFLWCFSLCLVGAMFAAFLIKDGHPTKADKVENFCIVLGLICLLGGPVSLVMNLPLTLKIIRQKMAIRRLGLSGASGALWKSQRKSKRWRVILRRVGRAVTILAFATGVLVAYAGFGLIMGTWCVLALGVLFLMMYVLDRGKSWLDMMSAQGADARKLQETMLTLRKSEGGAGAASIEVPSTAIQQFSRIESEQIARSRVTAIAESAKASNTEYSILPSTDVRKTKAGLRPEQRLKVEEVFDALMLEPRPSGAKPDAATGFLRQTVNGTNLELLYAVDDAARQLKLVSLRQSEVGSAAHA